MVREWGSLSSASLFPTSLPGLVGVPEPELLEVSELEVPLLVPPRIRLGLSPSLAATEMGS